MRKLTLVPILLCLAAAASPVAAHVAGGSHSSSWNPEVWLPVSLATVSWWYALGRWRMPTAAAASPYLGRSQIAAFAAGMLTLVVALESPLDTIAADLFSVHMVQHLLLMLVAAPLFVWSRPLIAFLWALERGQRKSIGRWWGGGLRPIFALLTSPISVWLWFCGLFAFWHLPGPYAWALTHEPVHVLEHLCFFVSAFAFWSIVIEPSGRRRLDYGATLLFVASAALISGLPGALMILTSRPFYAIHAAGAARWGMTPIEDQQLAGLVMWIPASFIYIASIIILLALWLRAAERRSVARFRRLAALGSATMLLVLTLSGCDKATSGGSADQGPSVGIDADPKHGAEQIAQIGCGVCHVIPGIKGANALVGPPLDHMSRRIYVAGVLRNTPDNMISWLLDPQKIVPGNAMPNMHLKPDQARDIAAYLSTLR